ncbi:hypothetical protein GCM10028819_13110 [Spirosoma humi]
MGLDAGEELWETVGLCEVCSGKDSMGQFGVYYLYVYPVGRFGRRDDKTSRF